MNLNSAAAQPSKALGMPPPRGRSMSMTRIGQLTNVTQAAQAAQEEVAVGCHDLYRYAKHSFRTIWSSVLKLYQNLDVISAMLIFQLVFMLLCGLRVSIVSLGYLFFWQATVPLLLSRYRHSIIRSRKFYIAQIALLVWSSLSVLMYAIYFIVMAARPDLEDPGRACTFFISGNGMPRNSSEPDTSSFYAEHVTPFCILALERISTGAEIILMLVDVVMAAITFALVRNLRSRQLQEEEMQALDETTAEQRSLNGLENQQGPLKALNKADATVHITTGRNGRARVLFAVCIVGVGSLSPTPLSFPAFLLFLVELLLFTMQYGASSDIDGSATTGGMKLNKKSDADVEQERNHASLNRAKHIFGSTSPYYWLCVALYLFCLNVAIYVYNLHGVPPVRWSDGTQMPIGLSVCTLEGMRKNFIQHHLHFLCLLASNVLASLFLVNALFVQRLLSRRAVKSASASKILLRMTSAPVPVSRHKRYSLESDPGNTGRSAFIYVVNLTHIWLCWIILLTITLEHKTVLSFVFFLFLCFALIKHEWIFAKGDEGLFGNIFLIVWTCGYALTCYIGSIVMTLGGIEDSDILNDLGIMKLYGENATKLDLMVSSRQMVGGKGVFLPLVLKIPFTVLALIMFCIVFRYRKDDHVNFETPFFFQNLMYVADHGGLRWVSLLTLFFTAVTTPDLVRYPFMIIFVMVTLLPKSLGNSKVIWGLTILYTQALILVLFFGNFSFTSELRRSERFRNATKRFFKFHDFEPTNIYSQANASEFDALSTSANETVTSQLIELEVDMDQVILPIFLLGCTVLQFMSLRRKQSHEATHTKHGKVLEFWEKVTPEWAIIIRPIVFFCLFIALVGLVLSIFLKESANVVSMFYFLMPVVASWSSMCLMEPKDELEMQTYGIRIMKRTIRWFKRFAYGAAFYSGLVLLVQHLMVAMWPIIDESLKQRNISLDAVQDSDLWLVRDSGLLIFEDENSDPLHGVMQWEGIGENFCVLLLSITIASCNPQWICYDLDKKKVREGWYMLDANNYRKDNIDDPSVLVVIFQGAVSSAYLATPVILVGYLFLGGVRDYSIVGFFYYVLAVWRLATLTQSLPVRTQWKGNRDSRRSFMRKVIALCVCQSSTFWWQAALLGSPLFALSISLLNFPGIGSLARNSKKELEWLGLFSDSTNLAELIYDHVFVMVIAGSHGFITRFWSGRRGVIMRQRQKLFEESEKQPKFRDDETEEKQEKTVSSIEKEYKNAEDDSKSRNEPLSLDSMSSVPGVPTQTSSEENDMQPIQTESTSSNNMKKQPTKLSSHTMALLKLHETEERGKGKRSTLNPGETAELSQSAKKSQSEHVIRGGFLASDTARIDLQTTSGRQLTFDGTAIEDQACCERSCLCCFVLCPLCCCCCRKSYNGADDTKSDSKINDNTNRNTKSPCLDGRKFCETACIAMARRLYLEVFDFKNSNRLMRHLSLEACLVVFVVAACTRRDLVAILYLCISFFILCSSRRTVSHLWTRFVKAPLFVINILQYLVFLGVPMDGFWTGFWRLAWLDTSSNITSANASATSVLQVNGTYSNIQSIDNETLPLNTSGFLGNTSIKFQFSYVLSNNTELLRWFDLYPIERDERRYDTYLIDLILLAITMYQGIIFQQSKADEIEFGNRVIGPIYQSNGIQQHLGHTSKSHPGERRPMKGQSAGFMDLLQTNYFEPARKQIPYWGGPTNALSEESVAREDTSSDQDLKTETNVRKHRLKGFTVPELSSIKRRFQRPHHQISTHANILSFKDLDSLQIYLEKRMVALKHFRMQRELNEFEHPKTIPVTGDKNDTSGLEDQLLSNTEYVYEQTKQARALVECGHLDFTSRHVRDVGGWFIQLCILTSLQFGPKCCALAISILCLFEFSIMSIGTLILALRCLLGSFKRDHNMKRVHQEKNQRFIHLLAYSFFIIVVRAIYEVPLIEAPISRSSFALSIGLLKTSPFDNFEYQMATDKLYNISIAIFAFSLIGRRFLMSPHNCFLVTREELDSMAAFKLATATLAKVEFQRDDELELISQRIHALQGNVQNLQSHSNDQTKIDQKIDRYLLDHEKPRSATSLVFHRSGKLKSTLKKKKLRKSRKKNERLEMQFNEDGEDIIHRQRDSKQKFRGDTYSSASSTSDSLSSLSSSDIDSEIDAFSNDDEYSEDTNVHRTRGVEAGQASTFNSTGNVSEFTLKASNNQSTSNGVQKSSSGLAKHSTWSSKKSTSGIPRNHNFGNKEEDMRGRSSLRRRKGKSDTKAAISSDNISHAIKSARKTMMKGLSLGLDTIAQGIKDAHEEVEAASAPNVGHLHVEHESEEERTKNLGRLDNSNAYVLGIRKEARVLLNLVFSNSLYIAIFFMLLDWIVNMSYITAVYPVVVFCYILIQNPLQLPLIQTDEEGIVYEQDRLTLSIVDALVDWIMKNGGAKDTRKNVKYDLDSSETKSQKSSYYVHVDTSKRRERINDIIQTAIGEKLFFFTESELKLKIIDLLEENGICDIKMLRKNIEKPVSLGFATRCGHPTVMVDDARSAILAGHSDLESEDETIYEPDVLSNNGISIDQEPSWSADIVQANAKKKNLLRRKASILSLNSPKNTPLDSSSASSPSSSNVYDQLQRDQKTHSCIAKSSLKDTNENHDGTISVSAPANSSLNRFKLTEKTLSTRSMLKARAKHSSRRKMNSRSSLNFKSMFEDGSTVKVTFHYKPSQEWSYDSHSREYDDSTMRSVNTSNRLPGKHKMKVKLKGKIKRSLGPNIKILAHETVVDMLDDLRRADKEAQLPPKGYVGIHRAKRISLFDLKQRAEFEADFRKIIKNVQAGKISRHKAATRAKAMLKKIKKAQQKRRRDLQLSEGQAKALHYHKAVQPLLKTHDQKIWVPAYEVQLDTSSIQKGINEFYDNGTGKPSSLRSPEKFAKNTTLHVASTATLLEYYFPGYTDDFNVAYCCIFNPSGNRSLENNLVAEDLNKVGERAPKSSKDKRLLHHAENDRNGIRIEDVTINGVEGIDTFDMKAEERRKRWNRRKEKKGNDIDFRIIVSASGEERHPDIVRKISKTWVHPMVQLPPESLWNALIIYGLAVIVSKLAYQTPFACPCYQDWTQSNLNNASHLRTYSFYPYCNSSDVSQYADQCKWEKPSTVSRSDVLPYDFLLGVHKVYPERNVNNTVLHILDAQFSGALFENVVITLFSVFACIFHSYVMHRQKLYSILDFMRASGNAFGRNTSHPGSQSAERRLERSIGGVLKEHLNNVAENHEQHKIGRKNVALSSTIASSDGACDEAMLNSVMWQHKHQAISSPGSKGLSKWSSMGSSHPVMSHGLSSGSVSKAEKISDEEEDSKEFVCFPCCSFHLFIMNLSTGFLDLLTSFFMKEYFLNIEPHAVVQDEMGMYAHGRPKPGVDWYTSILLSQTMVLLYAIIFVAGSWQNTLQQWQNSTLSLGYVLIVFIWSSIMVLDRILYLYRSIVSKTILHIFWISLMTVVHHSNLLTDVLQLEGGSSLHWFVWLQLPYFYFSALQISYGYPPFVGGRLVVETEDWYYWCGLYLPFRYIPFVFEIKLVLDYFCTNTTFYLQDFIKYEDIRTSIYVIGTNLDWSHQEKRARGDPRPFCSRCCAGGMCFLLIFLALFLPLFLFTSGSAPSDGTNAVKSVAMQIGIEGYPDFFDVVVDIDGQPEDMLPPGDGSRCQDGKALQLQDWYEPTTYRCLEDVHPLLQKIPFRDRSAYAQREAQLLNISTSSGSNWPITTEAKRRLVMALREVEQGGSDSNFFPGSTNSSAEGTTEASVASETDRQVRINIRFTYTRKNNDIFPYIHEHVVTPIEAGALADVLRRDTVTDNDSSSIKYAFFKNFLPNFVRLPTKGEAHLLDFQGKQDASDCIFVLGTPILLEVDSKSEISEGGTQTLLNNTNMTNQTNSSAASSLSPSSNPVSDVPSPLNLSPSPSSLPSAIGGEQYDATDLINTIREDLQQYWSIQCGRDENDAQTAKRTQYLQVYVMSSQTSLGQFIDGASVFYIYSLLLLYLASTVRSMFSGGSSNTMFYDWPRHDVMKQYCEKIAECRALASLSPEDLKLFRRPHANGIDETRDYIVTPLEAEEEYFRELLDIYRRPDLLYERTGPSRHVSLFSFSRSSCTQFYCHSWFKLFTHI